MRESLAQGGFIGRHAEHAQELLAFVIEGELYATPLSTVQEIVVPPPLTVVPRAPRAVVGVCSVRGRLVTVVDFRLCIGLPPLVGGKRGRILLAQADDEEILGLRVDEVRHVVRLAPGELEWTNQTFGGDFSEGVLRGIGRPSSGEELVLIDMKAVLTKGCA